MTNRPRQRFTPCAYVTILLASESLTGCDREMASEVSDNGNAATYTGPIPQLTTSRNSNGSLNLSINEDLFSRYCTSLNLPPPPHLKAIDSTAYLELYEVAKNLSRNGSSDGYAAAGAIYYAYTFREKAIHCFRRAQLLAPLNHRWPHLLARLYKEIGRNREAINEAETATRLNQEYAPTLALSGDLYLTVERFDDALAAYSAYVTLRPQHAYGYFGRGKVAYRRKRFEEAAGHFREALSRAPHAHQVKYLYGRSLVQLGQPDAAATLLAAAGSATAHEGFTFDDPLFHQVHESARSILSLRADYKKNMAHKNWREAARACEAILERRPEDFGTMYNLASLHRQLGEHETAVAILRRALQTNPDFAPLHCGLAEVFLATGEPRKAIIETELALQGDPRLARALAVKGAAHLSLREWLPAETALTKATEFEPEKDRYFYYLGNALAAQGKNSRAILAYTTATKLNPANTLARARLAALTER